MIDEANRAVGFEGIDTAQRRMTMDALLSPRRRALLQALGAAALVAACSERRGVETVPPHPAGERESRDGALGRPSAPVTEFRGPTMGTSFTVKIAGNPLTESGAAAAREAVAGALEAIVAKMSTYDGDSELSRFNRHADSAPFVVSSETFDVFALAREVSAASGGAFDITIRPLVDAWGFGPSKMHRIVGAAEAAELSSRVGWRGLRLDGERCTLAKAHPGLSADLSGIAKGYGVECAARALEALGIGDYMIEAGGEVRTHGRNGEGRPWQIAIERPDAIPQRAHAIVPLSGLSMATSGDYRIYFESAGQRYCHEIDPSTGAPIRHGLASVSVVATDCGYADAMATALMVLGPERGYTLAEAQRLAACFIVRGADGKLSDRQTPAFAALGALRVPNA
jgi:FAD:protein FMN transferase